MSRTPETPVVPVQRPFVRVLLRVVAVLSLVLAIIGALLPGLPSTEFVLLAAWAAARSSPRMHAWLWRHRIFGPALQNWHDGRRVSRRSKWAATISMSLAAIILLVHPLPRWFCWSAIGCMACVLGWLWSRPLPKPR